MSELQWFRLLLFANAMLLFVGGGIWLYSTVSGVYAQREVVRWAETSRDSVDRCLSKDKTATPEQCANPHWNSLVDLHADERDRHNERAEVALWITLICLASTTVAFYGLRWVIAGRIRPLWLLPRVPRSSSGDRPPPSGEA